MATTITTPVPLLVTVLLFCHRLPTLTPPEFKAYIEQTHVPLVKSLLGADHPLTHTRYYTSQNAETLSPPTEGSSSSDAADLIAVITYESREMMQRSMAARQAPGTREIIEADENRFMVRDKIRVVVLGEGDVEKSERDE